MSDLKINGQPAVGEVAGALDKLSHLVEGSANPLADSDLTTSEVRPLLNRGGTTGPDGPGHYATIDAADLSAINQTLAARQLPTVTRAELLAVVDAAGPDAGVRLGKSLAGSVFAPAAHRDAMAGLAAFCAANDLPAPVDGDRPIQLGVRFQAAMLRALFERSADGATWTPRREANVAELIEWHAQIRASLAARSPDDEARFIDTSLALVERLRTRAGAAGLELDRITAAVRGEPSPAGELLREVEAALKSGSGNLSSKLSLRAVSSLAEQASEQYRAIARNASPEAALAYARTIRDGLAELRAREASSPLTELSLDTLSIIVEYASVAGFDPGADYCRLGSDRERLESWLALAARGRGDMGLWYAPFVFGSAPVGGNVVKGIDDFMHGLAPGARAEAFYFAPVAKAAANRRDPKTRLILWGHSMGGRATLRLSNELPVERIRLAMPVDTHDIRIPYDAVPEGIPVFNFFQPAMSPFDGEDGVERIGWPGRNPPGIHSEQIIGASHMSIVDAVYERGLFQMAIARTMFRDRGGI